MESEVAMIRGVLKKGMIQPLDPLPPEWREGREVLIGVTEEERAEIDRWAAEVERSAAEIPPEDHEIMLRAIEAQRREGKEWMRREHERLSHLERDE